LNGRSTLLHDLVELLLPKGCLGCGERIPPEEKNGLICPPCRSRLRQPPAPTCPRCQAPKGTGHPLHEECLECQDWPPVLQSARAAVLLCPTAGSMVHALKYRGWAELAEFMAERMSREAFSHLKDPVLVPVPTTKWRRRTRGYNQAAILARALARRCSLPMVEALLRRGGRTQVRLGPREREANVQGAFSIKVDFRSHIRGREVILIDDVLTTGATAASAAQALVFGDPQSVHLRTFARALPFAPKGVSG